MRQMSRGNVLAIAVVLGMLTSALVYFYLARQKAETNPAVTVVVASRSIQTGSTITQDVLKLQERPKNSLPVGTAIDMNSVIGEVAKTEIQSGEPITLNNVTPKNRLAYVIPPFMRAVTVAVDPVVGVGGFLKAGDHVDVVATFVQNDASVTKTVLQDVLLLAAGTDLNGTSNNPNQAADQKPQGHATLAVMPPEAERLILADMRGKLRLTLRRPDDSSFVSAKGITGREVIGRMPADNPVLQTMPRFDIASTRAQAAKHASEVAKNVPLFAQMQFPPARMQNASVPIMPISDAKTIQIVRGAKIEQVEVAR